MKNTHKKIEIIDPQRWYLSFAQKRKHYVQIHSSIWSDPDFLALSSDTKVLFFWLLNASLRFNKESFSMCLESAKVTLKVSLGCIKGSLKELESNNIISLETKVRVPIEENRIEKNRIKEKSKSKIYDDIFNINKIYDLYPRKSGKKKGIEKLQSIIKDQSTYDNIMQGVIKYSNYCKQNKIEMKFIKQFSTWVNGEHWNDEYDLNIKRDDTNLNIIKSNPAFQQPID